MVTRIRILLTVMMIISAIYSAASLFTSLRDFGIGVAVVGLAWCCQGLLTYVHDHDIRYQRDSVWARRDGI